MPSKLNGFSFFQTIDELEKEMLNGQKLQGPPTAFEVNYMLKNKNMEDRLVYFIAQAKMFCRQSYQSYKQGCQTLCLKQKSVVIFSENSI